MKVLDTIHESSLDMNSRTFVINSLQIIVSLITTYQYGGLFTINPDTRAAVEYNNNIVVTHNLLIYQ